MRWGLSWSLGVGWRWVPGSGVDVRFFSLSLHACGGGVVGCVAFYDLLHACGARATFLFPTRVLFFPRLWARGVCAGYWGFSGMRTSVLCGCSGWMIREGVLGEGGEDSASGEFEVGRSGAGRLSH